MQVSLHVSSVNTSGFAHNGAWRGFGKMNPGKFKPVGETDSEALFCNILSVIEKTGGLSGKSRPQLPDALQRFNRLTSGELQSKINLLLSDGDTLVAYRDLFAQGTLYWLERTDGAQDQQTAVIATTRLTSEPEWKELAPGELCVCQKGERVLGQ